MASIKEIRTQISSIKSTQKITNAMEMVAASKMRRAQETMERSKPYAKHIRGVIAHLSGANTEYKHPYMINRDVKRVGYIIVSTDRGLCGGLNTNTFKQALKSISINLKDKIEVDLCLIGTKSNVFFRNQGLNIASSLVDIGEKVDYAQLIGCVKVMLDAYINEKIDRLYLVSNEYINTMTQQPKVETLIPLQKEEEDEKRDSWDYIYEPDSQTLLEGLLVRYIESQVYQAVVENGACEQAARMLAMKNATDNAGSLIDDLELVYNKARQAAITQELSEIVSGAAAV